MIPARRADPRSRWPSPAWPYLVLLVILALAAVLIVMEPLNRDSHVCVRPGEWQLTAEGAKVYGPLC